MKQTNRTLEDAPRDLYWKYHFMVALFFFVSGLCLMLWAAEKHGVWWHLVAELGAFVAAIIATHIIHEILVKDQEQQFLMKIVEKVIESNSSLYDKESGLVMTSRFMDLASYTNALRSAKHRIWILRTWFPELELMEVSAGLRSGLAKHLNIEILIMSPNSVYAKARGSELGMQNPESVEGAIIDNLKQLAKLSAEYQHPSNFKVKLYTGTATLSILGKDNELNLGFYWREENCMKAPHLKLLMSNDVQFYFSEFAKNHFLAIGKTASLIDFKDNNWYAKAVQNSMPNSVTPTEIRFLQGTSVDIFLEKTLEEGQSSE